MSTSYRDTRVTVAGAGLGGTLAATMLAQLGFEVELFERRADLRASQAERGRSINLAVSARGIHALEQVGLAQEILEHAIPMRGRMLHQADGTTSYLPYSASGKEAIWSFSRTGLNQALLDAAERLPNLSLRFRHRCTDADLATGSATFLDEATGQTFENHNAFLVGADGAFSAVRRAMQRLDRFDYRQDFLSHGYKELTIPARSGGGFALDPHALHIWPRGSFMMIALPNRDESFTCTIFWPFEGPDSFAELVTPGRVRAFFERHFADAVPLMPTLIEDFLSNPTSSLVTVRCAPWYVSDKIVLLGDAAHAVVPFYGQGMNASFEDCVVLKECLVQHELDFGAAFRTYFARRKPHVDALAELAIGNFLEMRDKVASRWFRGRKHLEHLLQRLLPFWYLPLYDMVSFTRIPYGDAVARARHQDRTVLGAALGLGLLLASAALLFGVLR